ncbi:hypothetical protein B0H13DRAFT_1700567, partial [Mycena leptocephala]
MVASIVFITVLASSVLVSQADLLASEPGPGEAFNEGSTCRIGWVGDDSGSTTWKTMTIELMTGSNLAMVSLLSTHPSVATGLDGTTAGTFTYTCPEVTPNSPIYFYQFSAGINTSWSARFTIAAEDGSSTPATESDGSNSYGNGKLVASSGNSATGPVSAP